MPDFEVYESAKSPRIDEDDVLPFMIDYIEKIHKPIVNPVRIDKRGNSGGNTII